MGDVVVYTLPPVNPESAPHGRPETSVKPPPPALTRTEPATDVDAVVVPPTISIALTSGEPAAPGLNRNVSRPVETDTGNDRSTAAFWPPAAAKISKFVSAGFPLMSTSK